MVSGYKCLNRYGKQIEVGKTYFFPSNNFIFYKTIEDSLKGIDTTKEFDIYRVWGFGEIQDINNMYIPEKVFIEEKISREEILDYVFSLDDIEIERFIMLYPLNEEEKEIIKNKNVDVNKRVR